MPPVRYGRGPVRCGSPPDSEQRKEARLTTAIIFAAVSSSPQEISLDQQVIWAQGVAKEQGWEIVRVVKGVSSGKLGTRKLLDDLLADLRATPKHERPRWLLLVRIDRLGRGTGIEAMAALAELKRLGISVWSREDGAVSIERASDAILPSIRAIVSALEGETRSDRVRAGQARRRAAGKHLGAIPYGTVLLDGRPVVYEPEAQIVRRIFELIAAGWGLERIAGEVRPIAPPKRMEDGSERHLTWGQSTIRSLYRSETVRAIVIEPDALARAEAARASNYRFRPTGAWVWPLRGAVRCTCGHLLIGHATGTAPHRVRYYRCRSHPYDDRPEGNRRPGHRADKLEASFIMLLEKLSADPSIMVHRAPQRGEQRKTQEATLKRQIEKLDHRRKRACELAEDGGYSGKELRERLDGIDRERRALKAQLDGITLEARQEVTDSAASTRLVDDLKRLPGLWPAMPIEGRQAIAKALSTYLGGLYADPKAPGKLFIRNEAIRGRNPHLFATLKVVSQLGT